jgi:DNA-binding NarL/FixJ family response regulator
LALGVLLADDHQLVRQGLRALLEREGMQVLGEAPDGHEAVRLAQGRSFDVAVLDLSMPRLNGLDAAQEILQMKPKTAVVMLTMHQEEHQILAAMRAGIRGYVLKTQAAEELVRAIHDVARGGIYLSPSLSRIVVDAYLAGGVLPSDPLTPRERQVLQLVAEGRSTKEVASTLHLSVKTAETYRARLMQKLNIHETAGLVRYAIRHGVISPALAWCAIFAEDAFGQLLLGLS